MGWTTTFNTKMYDLHQNREFAFSLKANNHYLGTLSYSINKGILVNSDYLAVIYDEIKLYDGKYYCLEIVIQELSSIHKFKDDALLIFQKDIIDGNDYNTEYVQRDIAIGLPGYMLIRGANTEILNDFSGCSTILSFPGLNKFCNLNYNEKMFSNNLLGEIPLYTEESSIKINITSNITKESIFAGANSNINIFIIDDLDSRTEFYTEFNRLIRKYHIVQMVKDFSYVLKFDEAKSIFEANEIINAIEIVFNILLNCPIFSDALVFKNRINQQLHIFKEPRCYIDFVIKPKNLHELLPLQLIMEHISDKTINFLNIADRVNREFPNYTDIVNQLHQGIPSEQLLNHMFGTIYSWFEGLCPDKDKWQFFEKELITQIDVNDQLKNIIYKILDTYIKTSDVSIKDCLFGACFYAIRTRITHGANNNKIELNAIAFKMKLTFMTILMILIRGYVFHQYIGINKIFVSEYLIQSLNMVD